MVNFILVSCLKMVFNIFEKKKHLQSVRMHLLISNIDTDTDTDVQSGRNCYVCNEMAHCFVCYYLQSNGSQYKRTTLIAVYQTYIHWYPPYTVSHRIFHGIFRCLLGNRLKSEMQNQTESWKKSSHRMNSKTTTTATATAKATATTTKLYFNLSAFFANSLRFVCNSVFIYEVLLIWLLP